VSEKRAAKSLALAERRYCGIRFLEKRMIHRPIVLFLCSVLAASHLAAQAPPAQPPEESPADGVKQPPPSAEDPIAGYRKIAESSRADWKEMETQYLPEIEKLGTANPCTSRRIIPTRTDSLRNAAEKYFADYGKYLEKWNDYVDGEMQENQKFWADMRAHQTDIPALIKTEEGVLEEIKRKQANVSAQDEDLQREYEKLIEASQAKLEIMRGALKDIHLIDERMKSSQEFWNTKLEAIKKWREGLDQQRLAIGTLYNGIVQQWKTACTLKTEPQPLRDLGVRKK
jgi:hypothetical protein